MRTVLPTRDGAFIPGSAARRELSLVIGLSAKLPEIIFIRVLSQGDRCLICVRSLPTELFEHICPLLGKTAIFGEGSLGGGLDHGDTRRQRPHARARDPQSS